MNDLSVVVWIQSLEIWRNSPSNVIVCKPTLILIGRRALSFRHRLRQSTVHGALSVT